MSKLSASCSEIFDFEIYQIWFIKWNIPKNTVISVYKRFHHVPCQSGQNAWYLYSLKIFFSSYEGYFVSNQNLKLRNHRVSAGDKRELTDNFSGIEQWTSHKGWLSVKRFLSSDKFIFVKKEKKNYICIVIEMVGRWISSLTRTNSLSPSKDLICGQSRRPVN